MLFAEMLAFGIALSGISVVNLVMADGLAVDYSAHHAQLPAAVWGITRAHSWAAMLDIGAAVLLGVLSALLGICVLGGSNSEVLRTFFKLLMGTIVFGGLVGVVFLPVLLALLGPSSCLAAGAKEHTLSRRGGSDEPNQRVPEHAAQQDVS